MLKIIIVEDEDFIRKGIMYTINWLSMDCVIVADAADGEEGLEKIIKYEPDIVITDIKMPKMDGMEMICKAQKYVRFYSLILTSYSEFDYAKKAIELRAYDYLLKPVDEGKIKRIINTLHNEIDTSRKEALLLENTRNNESYLDLNYYMQADYKENNFVKTAIQKIADNYVEKISVESISEEIGVSASYLSRKFKEATNHTFLDLLNRYRVQQAVKLLCTEKYRVYEISDMTGFSDYKHFCAVFKKYTSMSPTGFIKRRR